MTNESKRHAQDLADAGERCCKRATLYHWILLVVLDYLREYQPETGIICSECGRAKGHEETCIGYEIERALDADADEIAALLAAWNEDRR